MPETREWTLMFYFASDNPLAPGIVSQLKTIKQAGFHPEVNVIAQFDPQTEGTPTHIFDVNYIRKLKKGEAQIGFTGVSCADPFVPDLIEDKLWRGEVGSDGKTIKEALCRHLSAKHGIEYAPPEPPVDRKILPPVCPECQAELKPGTRGEKKPPRELNPKESLGEFLKFCRESYPARHYALFILGHGVVVSNDVFLFDESADHQSLSLKELAGLLENFREGIPPGSQFELVSFHSCSVSSLEVAYELKGTANYMLASQGPAFIGSWPYRQILMRIFGDASRPQSARGDGRRGEVKALLDNVFDYCYHNSADYLLAGYSFDLCLTDLNGLDEVKERVGKLTAALVQGLSDGKNPVVRNLALLAHWESQSQWQENYTDLCDFCLCFVKQYNHLNDGLGGKLASAMGADSAKLEPILTACEGVIELLRPVKLKNEAGGGGRPVMRSEYAGPAHQFSHGLSVYFPWSQPPTDRQSWIEYKQYKFACEAEWLNFLERYFAVTERPTRKEEDEDRPGGQHARPIGSQLDEDARRLYEDQRSLVYNDAGRLSRGASSMDTLTKTSSRDPAGDECTCGTVKNHPRDTRSRRDRHQSVDNKKGGGIISSPPMSIF